MGRQLHVDRVAAVDMTSQNASQNATVTIMTTTCNPITYRAAKSPARSPVFRIKLPISPAYETISPAWSLRSHELSCCMLLTKVWLAKLASCDG